MNARKRIRHRKSDVCKAYLQHKRHRCVHDDDDGQSDTPVVGDAHDLGGGGQSDQETQLYTLSSSLEQFIWHIYTFSEFHLVDVHILIALVLYKSRIFR